MEHYARCTNWTRKPSDATSTEQFWGLVELIRKDAPDEKRDVKVEVRVARSLLAREGWSHVNQDELLRLTWAFAREDLELHGPGGGDSLELDLDERSEGGRYASGPLQSAETIVLGKTFIIPRPYAFDT